MIWSSCRIPNSTYTGLGLFRSINQFPNTSESRFILDKSDVGCRLARISTQAGCIQEEATQARTTGQAEKQKPLRISEAAFKRIRKDMNDNTTIATPKIRKVQVLEFIFTAFNTQTNLPTDSEIDCRTHADLHTYTEDSNDPSPNVNFHYAFFASEEATFAEMCISMAKAAGWDIFESNCNSECEYIASAALRDLGFEFSYVVHPWTVSLWHIMPGTWADDTYKELLADGKLRKFRVLSTRKRDPGSSITVRCPKGHPYSITTSEQVFSDQHLTCRDCQSALVRSKQFRDPKVDRGGTIRLSQRNRYNSDEVLAEIIHAIEIVGRTFTGNATDLDSKCGNKYGKRIISKVLGNYGFETCRPPRSGGKQHKVYILTAEALKDAVRLSS